MASSIKRTRGTPQGVQQGNPQGAQDYVIQLMSHTLLQGDNAERAGAGEFMHFQNLVIQQANDLAMSQNLNRARAQGLRIPGLLTPGSPGASTASFHQGGSLEKTSQKVQQLYTKLRLLARGKRGTQ